MKKFLCYDTNDAASGRINVDSRGMLKPNSTVPSTNGAPYQQLVTDGEGNAKWATVNSVIYRGSDGELSVDEYMEIDGYPASIENMMSYGSILLIDDVNNGAIAPCISAVNSGHGYYILTFMLVGESSTKLIKIKVVGGNLVYGEISIIES